MRKTNHLVRLLLVSLLPLLPFLASGQAPIPGGLSSEITSGNLSNYVQLDQGGYSQCLWFSVEDKVDYFLPHSFMSEKGTYNVTNSSNPSSEPTSYRTFIAGTSYSLYLPFPFGTSASTSSVGVYALSYYNRHDPSNPNDNTFVFQRQSSTCQAFMPYIARIDADYSAASPNIVRLPDAVNITVPASPTGFYRTGTTGTVFTDTRIPVKGTFDNSLSYGTKLPAVFDYLNAGNPPVTADGNLWTLSGTTESIDALTASNNNTYYFGSDGLWYKNNGTYALNEFRVFLIPNSLTAVPSAKMFGGYVDQSGNPIGNTTTGIGGVTSDTGNSEQGIGSNSIYTIGGEYVGKSNDINTLPKGIYIVNGKKVMK